MKREYEATLQNARAQARAATAIDAMAIRAAHGTYEQDSDRFYSDAAALAAIKPRRATIVVYAAETGCVATIDTAGIVTAAGRPAGVATTERLLHRVAAAHAAEQAESVELSAAPRETLADRLRATVAGALSALVVDLDPPKPARAATKRTAAAVLPNAPKPRKAPSDAAGTPPASADTTERPKPPEPAAAAPEPLGEPRTDAQPQPATEQPDPEWGLNPHSCRAGDRIQLASDMDDPAPIPRGATGRITNITHHDWQDGTWSQISVAWDPPHEQRTLMLTSPPDVIVPAPWRQEPATPSETARSEEAATP